jgi:predicted RNase H-like HicB family nuclease
VSQGSTEDEAVETVREAILLCLEVREERKMPQPREVRRIHVADGRRARSPELPPG